LSYSSWFAALDSAVKQSGILWVIARPAENEGHPDGQPAIELDPTLTEAQREALFAERLATSGISDLPTKHTIRLVLPRSKFRLWLGIARAGFGPELNFDSPWRVFLTDLANVCDAALDSLRTQRAVEEGLQNQNVIAIALIAGSIMHQVLNLMRDTMGTTQMLGEEIKKSGIKLNDRCESLIQTQMNTAMHGRELAQTFRNVTKFQGPWPCGLRETIDEAVKLYRYYLRTRNIEVKIDPSTKLNVDVPYFVSVFALANLIGNARDAIWGDGWIKIEAEETEQYIDCHVTNSGPEIPPQIKERLFRFGQSFKDGHNGWGLYFVKRTMKAHGGNARLAYSNHTGTRFTIRFPQKHPSRDLTVS